MRWFCLFIVMIGMKITLSFRITKLNTNKNKLNIKCGFCCWIRGTENGICRISLKKELLRKDIEKCQSILIWKYALNVHWLECSVGCRRLAVCRLSMKMDFIIIYEFRSDPLEWMEIYNTQITSNIIWCRQTIQHFNTWRAVRGNINRSAHKTEPKANAQYANI